MHRNRAIMTLFLVFSLLTTAGVSACQGGEPAPLPIPSQPLMPNTAGISPSCFQPSPSNPILKNGDHFKGSGWNDPSVLYVNGQFIMYASAGTEGGDVNVYRLVSNDGVKWSMSPQTPVLAKSESGWDNKNIETPSVVFFKGQYHMFYTGYNTGHEDVFGYKIGHAVSADGIQWTRRNAPVSEPTNPKAKEPNFDFNQYIVGEPGAIVYGNEIYVYFTAVGVNKDVGSTLQTIGLITSPDGEAWSQPVPVLSPDQSVYPRSAGVVGFSTPSAIKIGNEVHLFTDVAREIPDWTQIRLHHAVSKDGKTGWVQDPVPTHSRGDFQWAQAEIRSPAPVLVGDKLYLYYAGHTNLDLGIGLSICDLKK